jgi:outer membrane receptor protein involved in Fe transport
MLVCPQQVEKNRVQSKPGGDIMSVSFLYGAGRLSKFAVATTRFLVVVALLTPTLSVAQGIRGTISGTVTDPNGAVVQNATVKLIDVARQQEIRTVQTNDQGIYQFVEIEPAIYDVVIAAQGFAEVKLTNVKVEPNRNVQIDASLKASGAAEEITVSASSELVERQSATLGTTVDSKRVVDLPLNGRNVLDLANLQPGVTPGGAGGGLGIRVNGGRTVENNIQLDGSNNNEVAVGAATGVQPRPDAVQEFRLLTSNFEAEFGRNSGSVINVVTKSGTNDFHGNVRFFWRPTVLSAARFFDQDQPSDRALTGDGDFRRRFERKEIGGNIGGPVWLPGLYNGREKTFFFFDYEARRQLIGDTRTLTSLPSAAERAGNFSGLGRIIRDPATGAPFPGNQVPDARISPIARFYLQFIPTGDATGQASVGANDVLNSDQITTRVDHVINDKQALNVTFSWFDVAQFSPFAFGGASVPGFGSFDVRTTSNYIVRHTYSLTPNLINSFLVNYARNDQPSVVPENPTTPAEIGFTANFVANSNFAGPPRITFFDRNFNVGNTIQGPQARVSENFQLQDSVSWVTGNHRLKFGFDGTQYRQDQTFLFVNQGIFTFSRLFGGNTTGDDFADFLIGNSPIALQFGANGERDFRQKQVSFFGQDTWRVNDSLTLSLGLRWEYTSPLTDKFNRVSYFRQGAVSELLTSGRLRTFEGLPITVPPGFRAPVGLVFVGDPDPVLGGLVPAGGVEKDWNNWAPRLGIAYSPSATDGWMGSLLGDRKTVIRAGFGVYYGAVIGDTALQQLTAPGFNGTNSFFFPASGTLANPFGPDPFPAFGGNQGQVPNPFEATEAFIFAPLSQFSRSTNPFIRTPYTYQMNFTVERAFKEDYVASVSYVGSIGRKLYALEQVNPAVGTFIPVPAGRVIPAPTPGNVNARRLNPDIQLGISEMVSAGNSSYHSLQTNLQKRFSNGLLFQVAYTFSKSIADSDQLRDGLDLLDRRFGRSLSADDIPHRFVTSWIYEFPFYRGGGGALSRLLGGWSIGGIAEFQSGRVFSVGNPFDTVGTGGGVLSLADHGAPFTRLDPRQTGNRAFNVNAFRTFGAAASFPQLRRGTSSFNQFRLGNGVNNWDLILAKKTRLWNETTNLEFRVEAFNAFNHTQFTTANLNLNNVVMTAGQPDPVLSGFGKFTAAREARVIQLGARLQF